MTYKLGDKVKFLGIPEMPQYESCNTEIVKLGITSGCYYIHHENGYEESSTKRKLLFVKSEHLA